MEKCTQCGKDKQMFYRLVCFHCEKPSVTTVQKLDLLPALYHIQAVTGDTGYKDRMWKWFNENYQFTNDSQFTWSKPNDPFIREQLYMTCDLDWYNDMVKFFEVFDEIEEDIVLNVSW